MILLRLTSDLARKNAYYKKAFKRILTKYGSVGDPLWKEFLKEKYDNGSREVPNTTETKDQFPKITVNTLFEKDDNYKDKLLREFDLWKSNKPESTEKSPKSNLDLDRARKVTQKHKKDKHLEASEFETTDNTFIRDNFKNVEQLEDYLLLLTGFANLPYKEDISKPRVDIYSNTISFKYLDKGATLWRWIYPERKEIVMEEIKLSKDAPKGLGTKIFSQTVEMAIHNGFKKLTCKAHRNDKDGYIGYKIWPKMGYDGEIPSKSKKALKEDTNFLKKFSKPPSKVSEILAVEGGIEWWDINGYSFHAEFDLTPGSKSLEVYQKYISKKMKESGKDNINDWLFG
jgi:hypothetical protein